MRYQQKEEHMPDVLIRGVESAALSRLDDLAQSRGVSRNTFLKNLLTSAARESSPLSPGQALAVLDLVSDLGEPDVMARAWR